MTICTRCGRDDETRLGICWDCADAGELRAARRTVAQHLAKAACHLTDAQWVAARFDLTWAWQRLTGTGDYLPGGYFDTEHPGWR